MKRIIGLGAGCALVAAALTMTASSARAQTTPSVTITLRLTINGTVPPTDNFFVTFPVNGGQFCLQGPLPPGQTTRPCVGGRTYVNTLSWPKGTTPLTLRFYRLTSLPHNQVSRQLFATQTVIPNANRTISVFFTYLTAATTAATPSTPSTGVAGSFALGAGLLSAGSAAVLLAACFRRRRQPLRRPEAA